MKKYFSLCLIIIVLLTGCSNNIAKPTAYSNDINQIKTELSHIPRNYNAETAVKDRCFVIVHGKLKSEINIMSTFISDSKNKKATSITIVQYTDEGNPIITKVIGDGEKYLGIEDDTRDSFSSPEDRKYWEFEYRYLNVYKENGVIDYYLVNDDKLTIKDIRRSLLSSQSTDILKFKYLCSYSN